MFDVISVTARQHSSDFAKSIEMLAQSDVKAIILREKDLSEEDYYSLAELSKQICDKYGKQLIINSFTDVANKLGINSVHLPFNRFVEYDNLHKDFDIVGTSVHSVSDAVIAQQKGADYIIAGHIFPTDCKKGLAPRGRDFFEEICNSVEIPVYAIGGINEDTALKLADVNANSFKGVCVMSALMQSENPAELVSKIRKNLNMKNNKYLLYAITDRQWLDGRELCDDVEKALKGGATIVQLRDKGKSLDELCAEAEKLKTICHKYNAPLIINDNVEVAKLVDADGVHLGQGDMSPDKARDILGNDKIIGVTARTVEQAIKAEKDGANYLGSGAVFGTSTKNDAVKMSPETLDSICKAVEIPVVAIGGINGDNIKELKGTHISGAAVVSGIFAAENIEYSTRELKESIEGIVYEK